MPGCWSWCWGGIVCCCWSDMVLLRKTRNRIAADERPPSPRPTNCNIYADAGRGSVRRVVSVTVAPGGDGQIGRLDQDAWPLPDPLVQRQRLSDHLVHVVVLVGPEPSREVDPRRRLGERLVALVEIGVLRARDR